MSGIILGIHITAAVLTIIYSVRIVIRPRGAETQLQRMWLSFVGVLMSGSVLVALHPASFGKFCAVSTVYVVALFAVWYRFKRTSQSAITQTER